MDLNKPKNVMKAFITFQFSYWSLIWMFHSRNLNTKILTRYMNELLGLLIRILWAFLNFLIQTIL